MRTDITCSTCYQDLLCHVSKVEKFSYFYGVKENEFDFKSRLPEKASRLVLIRLIIYTSVVIGVLLFLYKNYF